MGNELYSFGVMLAAITIIFCFVYRFQLQTNIVTIQRVMQAGVALSIIVTIGLCVKNKFQWNYVVYMVMAIGFIMRVGYMLYTPYNVRPHDIGTLDITFGGHAAYIEYIYDLGKLPDSNFYQFYHPPFFHFMGAVFGKIVGFIINRTDVEMAVEASKIVSCFGSCGVLLLVKKLCEEVALNKKGVFIAVAVTALHPNTFLLAGRVNNDSLVIFFIMLAVLFTVKWLKNQTWLNIVVLGIAFGLGMMTKISCGIIAFFTGPVMLYVLFRNWYTCRKIEKKWINKKTAFIIGELALFAVICFPLALWYPVRNLKQFNQPIGYTPMITPESDLYVGEESIKDRFLSFKADELLDPIYVNPHTDCNLPLYVVKCSIFGEFEHEIKGFIPRALICINMFLIIVSLIAMIYTVIRYKDNLMVRLGFPYLWLIYVCSFIWYNVKFPFGCTMDFRYIVPTAFLGGIFIGVLVDSACEKKIKGGIVLEKVMYAAIAVFGCLSVAMYTMLTNYRLW
ncbi:ArnT family glycosyltransferase [Anaeromicropila populeti]|uniref:ArnT family glycosyltransferase n=1 Tax=Anaeromicropila populeti TaxID=37658 RepID=UPI0015A5B1C9|nr:glycosyltransferase family 39 protein [Anaeromicropila populeti]